MLRLLSAIVLLALMGAAAALTIVIGAFLGYVLLWVILVGMGLFIGMHVALFVLNLFRNEKDTGYQKSNRYLQESTLEDEERLAELRLKLAHRLKQVKGESESLEESPVDTK